MKINQICVVNKFDRQIKCAISYFCYTCWGEESSIFVLFIVVVRGWSPAARVQHTREETMDDEFALCWNNFQDNIATGFQNLYDRGDLVDVTLACDGKLLQAHKIVLAICSPYFQEMFITNPCKHPISELYA